MIFTLKFVHHLHHSLSSSIPVPSKRQSKTYRCSLASSNGEKVSRPETVVSSASVNNEGRRVLLWMCSLRRLHSYPLPLITSYISIKASFQSVYQRPFNVVKTASGILLTNSADAVSTSRRALCASKIPESEFTTLPNGLKYYDIKVGNGTEAVKGSRVAVHYVAKWKGITLMTSRQGLGVGGGTPYGFDVGQSERGNVLKGLDLGVEGMRIGGQRLVIVPPELAYGKKGVQEIPPNATIELDIELLSIKQSPFGTSVKIVEG